ncbi:MAG TPA: hypothetical protein VFU49_00920, partial [Ktedonobacteraceae bacterium]|nr:hypothetical protein [Ktedonobacteraceae bacterium]
SKNDRKKKFSKNQRAFDDALRQFQDEYFAAVSVKYGHLRLGPRKRRKTKPEWHQEKVQARALKVALDESRRVRQAAAAEIVAANREIRIIRAEAIAAKNQAEADRKEAARIRMEAQALFDKANELVRQLNQWVAWSKKRALMIPKKLMTALSTAIHFTGPKP